METCVAVISRVESSVAQSANANFIIVKMFVENKTEQAQTPFEIASRISIHEYYLNVKRHTERHCLHQ